MTILHIVQRYYPAGGGSEKYMRVISEWAAKSLEAEVDLWTSDALQVDGLWDVRLPRIQQKNEKINNVNIRRFTVAPWPLNNWFLNRVHRKFLKAIPLDIARILSSSPSTFTMIWYALFAKLKKYDVVHVTASPFTILFLVASIVARRTGAKLVITPFQHLGLGDSDNVHRNYFKTESIKFYKEASAIFYQTEAERDALMTFTGVSKEKFVKLGMGVDLNELSGGDGARFRRKYGVNEKIVFYVGAKVKEKGAHNLIEAMKKLWAKGVKAKLVISGNETYEFKKYWESLDSETHAKILKFDFLSEEDKLDLYDAGDIFSMVSKSDSFGIVYLEAWAYKKPVIGCNIPAIKEIISDQIDGRLVEFDAIDDIASAIESLLDSTKLAKQMGENGHKKVLEKYQWKEKFEILRRVYASSKV